MDYSYHRLARSSPKYRWWRQVVAALIGGAVYVVFSAIIAIGWFVALAGTRPELLNNPAAIPDLLSPPDLTDALTFTLITVSLAALIPSVILARLIMGPRPVGLISSVAGRLRWRWLLRCVPIALLVFVVVFGITIVIPASSSAPVTAPTSPVLLLVVLALVLTPLQATAEEYVFRGFLMQAIGGWLRHPAFAILIPVPIFALSHTQYGPLGMLDVGAFALAAGYLTWRTGGLEAAIVAHVINNTALFILGALGLVYNGESDGSPVALLSTVVLMGSYTALVVWQAKRSGLSTTRTVLPPEPPMERWAPPESSLATVPGRTTDIPPIDSSAADWPPPPPRPTPIDRR